MIRMIALVLAILSSQSCWASDKLTLSLEFSFNSFEIISDDYSKIDAVGKLLESKRFRGIVMIIAGHADNIGDKDDNMTVSIARANAVKSYLLNHFNLLGSQLITRGFGDRHPIAQNDSDENRRINRRVEIYPAELASKYEKFDKD